MSEETKQKIKSHLFSAAISFVSAFALILSTSVKDISLDSISSTALLSIVFAAARAAGKGVLEDFLKTDKILGVRN